MARQIRLALVDEDLAAFVHSLALGPETRLVRNITSSTPTLEDVDNLNGGDTFFYLIRGGFDPLIRIDHHGLQKYRINAEESYVIQIWKPILSSTELRPGRVYYDPTPFVEGEYTKKEPAFVRWAERVFSRIKRGLKRDAKTGVYFGAHAQRLFYDGSISLAP